MAVAVSSSNFEFLRAVSISKTVVVDATDFSLDTCVRPLVGPGSSYRVISSCTNASLLQAALCDLTVAICFVVAGFNPVAVVFAVPFSVLFVVFFVVLYFVVTHLVENIKQERCLQ